MLEVRIVNRKPVELPDVSALNDRHLLHMIEKYVKNKTHEDMNT